MRSYIDLLRALPPTNRNITSRSSTKSAHVINVARSFGREYFDGDRMFGYGGYHYDGRWKPVVQRIIEHYGLAPAARVLDVGCAKGFLVSDMVDAGLDAYGLDISTYAVAQKPHPPAVGRLHLGLASVLPFPERSFDLVLSINTLHNLRRPRIVTALREISRVSRGAMFVQVDSYHTRAEKELFEEWVLTAQFHGYPDDWLLVFDEAGYHGDYAWTVVS